MYKKEGGCRVVLNKRTVVGKVQQVKEMYRRKCVRMVAKVSFSKGFKRRKIFILHTKGKVQKG